jgi:predicted RNA polymerase sigma factor
LKQEEKKEEKKEPASPSASPETRKESLPENAPSLGRQILDFVQHVLAGGLNVEQAVRAFLVANPEILQHVTEIVAAIVAGAILSDILSAGAAITKDPAVLSVLAAMVRIAGLLQAGTP